MNKRIKNAFLHPLVLSAIVAGSISVPTTLLTILSGDNKLSRLLIRADDIDSKLKLEVPAGTIVAYGGPLDEVALKDAGWLVCAGQSVRVIEFTNLFNQIRTTWGGDGVKNFMLPNLQGRFLRGVDSDGINDSDSTSRTNWRGVKVGAVVGSYQSDEVGQHNHEYVDGQPHNKEGEPRDTYDKGGNDSVYSKNYPRTTIALKGHRETRPKNAYVHYIIKY